jgi:hypothetical protein
MDLVKAGDA